MSTQHFHELRQRLVECRASLRAAKDTFETVKAQREQTAIDTGQMGGSNAEQRARSLTTALATDTIYLTALSGYRVCEAECERVEALLEAARDERRASEWQIRARLADALLGTAIQSDSADPAGDDAFDNTLTRTIDDRDQLWAEAIAAYQSGEPWELQSAEYDAQTAQNRTHEVASVLEDWIAAYFYIGGLAANNRMTAGEIIDHLRNQYDIRLHGSERSQAMEIARVLRRLGIEPVRTSTWRGYEGVMPNISRAPSALATSATRSTMRCTSASAGAIDSIDQ